ncbi:helix-turn-helix transcriptional regulator [Spongiactinospora sp. TRM90649]|uniref:helix-turn-helix domain-containing protein n=1 Tax=Spongiactinospora sp. TRM90649 TaxID=3031114 RepID=UPI0023F7AD58|nr:helix-turn-helix transcriptional regulator [Spongiactinospora sp. TRM90649]MDF5753199.1 helix-turn-helix transcriptional regulator [Spongiactinospora sp. TRM90649]
MPEGYKTMELAARLQTARKRRGLTQKELADLADISVSLVRKIEQGVVQDTRLETVRRLAAALRVPTMSLIGPSQGEEENDLSAHIEIWDATKRALVGRIEQPTEAPTSEGVRAAFDALKPLMAVHQYAEVSQTLPYLLRDADALNGSGRAIRSQLLNFAGWFFVQTRQYSTADVTLQLALDTADNRLDAAAAVSTMAWLHLRRGLLDEARSITTTWADEIEPRFSRATAGELSAWGQLLLFASAAAIRDNREGEAEDMLKLARAAAARIGHEILADTSTARTFGPSTVAMQRAENATIQDRPDKVLKIAEQIPEQLLLAKAAGRNRHHLDVANALVSTRRTSEALGVLMKLSQASPEWISVQHYAKDILTRVISRRRTLTEEMRALADVVKMPY